MPTYEYQCPDCGECFEKFQSISADPYADCPSCQTKVRRSVSGGTGIIFKGSGFYVTDYKGKSSGSSDKADKPKAGSENKTDKKAEQKPASDSKPAASSSSDK